MPSFFSNKKLIILLASLIVLVALIGFSFKEKERAVWPEQFVQDTVGWFQFLLERPAQYAAGFFGTVGDIENAYKENKELKANLEDFASVKQQNRDLQNSYQELKKQMKLQNDPDLSDYKKFSALVIGRSYDGWNQTVTVDKGSNDGVKTGMAVITSGGLIGKIGSVGKFTSKVMLISDKQNANQISAMVQKPKIYGMIEGFDEQKGVLLFQKIPVKANVKKGQVVETSGLTGILPSGLLIGKVTKVSSDQYGLTKIAEVKPSVDLNNLTRVMIVERLARTAAAGGN